MRNRLLVFLVAVYLMNGEDLERIRRIK